MLGRIDGCPDSEGVKLGLDDGEKEPEGPRLGARLGTTEG